MTVRIGIDRVGRIGRNAFRAAREHADDIDIVAEWGCSCRLVAASAPQPMAVPDADSPVSNGAPS
jgi:hypothetical protein